MIIGSLAVTLIAITAQVGLGLYRLHIGCPRAFGDCYRPGMDVLFWPQTISMLELYLALLALLFSLSKWVLHWLLRQARDVLVR